jgi:hypothetical protein
MLSGGLAVYGVDDVIFINWAVGDEPVVMENPEQPAVSIHFFCASAKSVTAIRDPILLVAGYVIFVPIFCHFTGAKVALAYLDTNVLDEGLRTVAEPSTTVDGGSIPGYVLLAVTVFPLAIFVPSLSNTIICDRLT